MPIYVYKCQKCKNIYEELFDKGNMKKEIRCVNCGSVAKLLPSTPAVKIMSEKRKETIKNITGKEINSYQEERQYMKEHNLVSVSRKEWEEIKAKRDSAWNSYNYDRQKIMTNMAEGIKKVVENRDERIRINKMIKEKEKEAERLISEGAKI